MFCYSGLDLDLLRNGKCQIECEASEDSCAWRTLLLQCGQLGEPHTSRSRVGLFRELIIRCGGGKQILTTDKQDKQEEKTIKALPYLLGRQKLKTTG